MTGNPHPRMPSRQRVQGFGLLCHWIVTLRGSGAPYAIAVHPVQPTIVARGRPAGRSRGRSEHSFKRNRANRMVRLMTSDWQSQVNQVVTPRPQPQGTIPEKCSRSGSTLIARPVKDSPFAQKRDPMAAILSQAMELSASRGFRPRTQTPTNGFAAVRRSHSSLERR